MKTLLLCLTICLALPLSVYSQNKSLGVGTTAPNANAALHVESPTSNQGIIIPRLSTAQRASFTGALTATDVGLIVFDTDLRALTIWNGSAWDVGMKAGEPITATNAATTGHAGLFENTNASNTNPALLVNTAGSGNAITANAPILATSFIGDGSALTNLVADSLSADAVKTLNIADGTVLDADISNTAAIAGSKINPDFVNQNITTTGSATAASFAGDGSALTNIIADSVRSNGVTGAAIVDFTIENDDISTTTSIFGSKILPDFGSQNISTTGTVTATSFAGDGSLLSNIVADSITGLGPLALLNNVGSVEISDNSITNDDVFTGAAIAGSKITPDFAAQNIVTTGLVTAASFIGDGSALTNLPFQSIFPLTDTLTNADLATDFDALNITYTGDSSRTLLNLNYTNVASSAISNPFRLTHAGQGAAFLLTQSGTLGTGAIFSLTNAANPQQAMRASTTGTGQAGNFRILNSSNTSPSLYTETSGSGPALSASNIGSGNGFAGLFSTTSAINTYPAIQASTAGTGTGVRVIQSGSSPGGGMDVFMQNPLSTAPGIAVTQEALGDAVLVNVNTVDTTYNAAIRSTNNSFGNAGFFQTTNANSPSPALLTSSNSFNGALEAIQYGPVGSIARLFMSDPTNTSDGIVITQSGTGNAITANRPIQASNFIGDGSGLTGVNAILAAGAVGSTELLDNSITNTDIDPTAAIEGTKIDPNFGGQNISTTGNITASSFSGDGSALTGISGLTLPYTQSTAAGTTAFDITNSGTAGYAGSFSNTNALNTDNALFVSVAGNANAIRALSTGGPAAYLQIANPSSPYDALFVTTNGTGPTLNLQSTNASNANPALTINQAGIGNAITANAPIQATSFIGDGSALTGLTASPGANSVTTGTILDGAITDADVNTAAAISGAKINPDFGSQDILSTGTITVTSPSITAFSATNTSGFGWAAALANNNAANGFPVLNATTNGTGRAGYFEITNAGNTQPAIEINHGGSGNAITANRPIQATSFIGDGSALTNIVASVTDVELDGGNGFVRIGTGTGAPVLNNTYVGAQSGQSTTGGRNSFFGSMAGQNTLSGSNNIFVGSQAGFWNTNGGANVAVGDAALYSNTTGLNNIAIGTSAGYTNSTGNNNTAVGYAALYANTAVNNTAVGYNALTTNTTGDSNTALGNQSLNFNTTGVNNTASGYRSLESNTIGLNNSAFGTLSLFANSTGSRNTAMGFQSLYQTTSSFNTAFGFQALQANVTGTNNSAFGYLANVGSGGLTNATAIGANALVNTSNSLVLGGVGANAVSVGIGTASPAASAQLHVVAPSGNLRARFETTGGTLGPYLSLAHGGGKEYIIGSSGSGNGVGANKFEIQDADAGLSRFVIDATGKVGLGTTAPAVSLDINATDAINVPDGNTAQRPGSPGSGALRYNTTENAMEYFNGTDWYFVSPKIAYVKDIKTDGTNGGSITADTWTTRVLNTTEGETSIVSLSANQLTLAPGEYILEASAPAVAVDYHQIRLQDVTNTTTIAVGNNSYASTSYLQMTYSEIMFRFVVSSTAAFEVQHICQATRSIDGLGAQHNFSPSSPEVYTQVKLTKLR